MLAARPDRSAAKPSSTAASAPPAAARSSSPTSRPPSSDGRWLYSYLLYEPLQLSSSGRPSLLHAAQLEAVGGGALVTATFAAAGARAACGFVGGGGVFGSCGGAFGGGAAAPTPAPAAGGGGERVTVQLRLFVEAAPACTAFLAGLLTPSTIGSGLSCQSGPGPRGGFLSLPLPSMAAAPLTGGGGKGGGGGVAPTAEAMAKEVAELAMLLAHERTDLVYLQPPAVQPPTPTGAPPAPPFGAAGGPAAACLALALDASSPFADRGVAIGRLLDGQEGLRRL